jgi:hypothetical protein
MALKVIIQPMHDKAPEGMDYNGQVIVNGHDWGIAYGKSGISNPTEEQKTEALKEAIIWEIETSKILYDTIDWVIGSKENA